MATNYLKPQEPLKKIDKDTGDINYLYPLVTSDQVLLEDGTRLNTVLNELDKAEIVAEVLASIGGASGGGSGSEWRKAVYLKTTEDLTYINVTQDDDGNSLSFDEALVVFTSARESEATANGGYVMSVAPEWKVSFNKYGVYSLPLYNDVYMCAVHFKKVADLIVETVKLNLRVAGSLSALTFDSILNRLPYGVMAQGDKYTATVRPHAIYYEDSAVFLDYFNSEGKMCAVTIGTDLASSVQIGAGSILEVWVK